MGGRAAAWNRACCDLSRDSNSYRTSESGIGHALCGCGRGTRASQIQPCDGGRTAGFRGRPGMAVGSRDGRAVAAMPDGALPDVRVIARRIARARRFGLLPPVPGSRAACAPRPGATAGPAWPGCAALPLRCSSPLPRPPSARPFRPDDLQRARPRGEDAILDEHGECGRRRAPLRVLGQSACRRLPQRPCKQIVRHRPSREESQHQRCIRNK